MKVTRRKNHTAPAWARTIYDLSSKLTEDFGGGSRTLKMAWVYLGLQGIYGYCWLVKDFAFR